tara:strand:+ start:299 stop:469 length:171 start_codon:yes stop_codon:yes gene_type:complete
MKTDCTKLDCFFRVGETCCNLCAVPDDSCPLYFPAEIDPAERPAEQEELNAGQGSR